MGSTLSTNVVNKLNEYTFVQIGVPGAQKLENTIYLNGKKYDGDLTYEALKLKLDSLIKKQIEKANYSSIDRYQDNSEHNRLIKLVLKNSTS